VTASCHYAVTDHVCCTDPEIFTPRRATDSDSRSANASIASSNKRVLRFLIAAAFSLCQVVNVY